MKLYISLRRYYPYQVKGFRAISISAVIHSTPDFYAVFCIIALFFCFVNRKSKKSIIKIRADALHINTLEHLFINNDLFDIRLEVLGKKHFLEP